MPSECPYPVCNSIVAGDKCHTCGGKVLQCPDPECKTLNRSGALYCRMCREELPPADAWIFTHGDFARTSRTDLKISNDTPQFTEILKPFRLNDSIRTIVAQGDSAVIVTGSSLQIRSLSDKFKLLDEYNIRADRGKYAQATLLNGLLLTSQLDMERGSSIQTFSIVNNRLEKLWEKQLPKNMHPSHTMLIHDGTMITRLSSNCSPPEYAVYSLKGVMCGSGPSEEPFVYRPEPGSPFQMSIPTLARINRQSVPIFLHGNSVVACQTKDSKYEILSKLKGNLTYPHMLTHHFLPLIAVNTKLYACVTKAGEEYPAISRVNIETGEHEHRFANVNPNGFAFSSFDTLVLNAGSYLVNSQHNHQTYPLDQGDGFSCQPVVIDKMAICGTQTGSINVYNLQGMGLMATERVIPNTPITGLALCGNTLIVSLKGGYVGCYSVS